MGEVGGRSESCPGVLCERPQSGPDCASIFTMTIDPHDSDHSPWLGSAAGEVSDDAEASKRRPLDVAPVRPPGPLSQAEMERLKAFLDALPPPAMSLEMVDGFFCALASGPDPVRAMEYLPPIWPNLPIDADPAEYHEIMNLLIGHQLWLTRHLSLSIIDPDYAHPFLLEEDENGVVYGNDWARGYLRGMLMRKESWDALHNGPAGKCLAPMWRLIHEGQDAPGFPDDPEMQYPLIPADQREDVLRELERGIVAAYRFFEPMRQAMGQGGPTLQTTVRRATPKVGRNEPCPCGSGRKFKRCCGAGSSA